DEILWHAAIDERNALAGHAFAVEGHAELERMVGVIGNGDVSAEERFAHAAVEAGTFILELGGGKIVKEETDEIENCGWCESDGVAAGRQFAGVNRHVRFSASALGKLLRVDGRDTGGVGLGPA